MSVPDTFQAYASYAMGLYSGEIFLFQSRASQQFPYDGILVCYGVSFLCLGSSVAAMLISVGSTTAVCITQPFGA